MNITISEREGRLAYLLLRKVISDKGVSQHKENEVKREVQKVAKELGVDAVELYALYRRLRNEILDGLRLPEKMDFKQG